MGAILALSLIALTLAPPGSEPLRWTILGTGITIIMLLVSGWGRPRREEHRLRQRLKESEALHEETERFFHALMESLPSNIYFKDTESHFLQVNQSMANHIGIDHPRDLLGKTDFDIFGPEHAKQAREDEIRILSSGRGIKGYVERETFPDGGEGWVITSKLPFRDHDGTIIGTLGISSDVTEMVKTSHALKRERNILRSLIDAIPDNIYIRDKEGTYLVVNQAMADFVGAEGPDDVQGKTPREFFPREMADMFLSEDQKVITTGDPVVNRKSQRTNNKGQKREMLISKVAVRDQEGEVFGIVGMNRDVTSEFRARHGQQRAERQIQEILDHSPAPIYVKSLAGRFLMVNDRFQQLCKFKKDEIIGKTDHEVFGDSQLVEEAKKQDMEVIRTGEPLQADLEFHTRAGTRTYMASKFPMRDPQGKLYAVGGIVIDITERKEAELALQKVNEELRKANEEITRAHDQLIMAEKMESIGRLAAGVAHEVKNPLAMIGQGLELLSRRIPEDDQRGRDTIARMQRGIDRAKKIVKGLVDFSSDRSLNIQPHPPEKIVREALELVDYELRKNEIEVDFHSADNLPNILIDQIRIEQVIVNLIINAVHAMEGPGKLSLSLSLLSATSDTFKPGSRDREKALDNDHRIQLLIRDTGSGIPEELLDKIFDPFFTTKETGKGTGLGLSVSKKIIQLHGGKLALRNRADGLGAEAEILFKIAPGEL